MRPLVVLILTIILVPLALVGAISGLFLLWGPDLPSPHNPQEVEPPRKTVVLDHRGETIAEFFIENRSPMPLAQIPEVMRQAVLATEDRRFFRHWGVDLPGVLRAITSNVAAGGIRQGASTITQQLARNAFLSHSQTMERKVKEAVLAIRLERSFSKEEILEFYLNRIYFGEGTYGVEAASQRYFGKSCRDLTLPEAAMLAGLPANPGAYSPSHHPEAAQRRRNSVLRRMEDTGVIDRQTRSEAENADVRLANGPHGESPSAYFTEMVRQELMGRFGGAQVYEGGLTVYTTLDLGLQRAAVGSMETQLKAIEMEKAIVYRRVLRTGVRGDSTAAKGAKTPYLQGALIALEPQNGAIRALVGGRSFAESNFNRAVQARRQPGSAFKPIVAAQALRQGYNPNSILQDTPVSYHWGGQTWSPQNFDHKFRGPVTLRYTLQKSINVPTIRLLDALGARNVVEMAERMGFTGHITPQLSLALGTAEVTPEEITSAYGSFANRGIRVEPYAVDRVEDRSGRVLLEHQPVSHEVLDERNSFTMISLLRSVIDHGTGYPARGKYHFDAPAAGKTGTTDDYSDAWFVGFIPRLVCGVWVGFDARRSIGSRMTGAAAALPAWCGFMNEAVKVYGTEDFAPPEGSVLVTTCVESGLPATPGCPRKVTDAYEPGTEPTKYCTMHSGMTPAPDQGVPAEDEAPTPGE
jgi:penicillin-binding protein 1A